MLDHGRSFIIISYEAFTGISPMCQLPLALLTHASRKAWHDTTWEVMRIIVTPFYK